MSITLLRRGAKADASRCRASWVSEVDIDEEAIARIAGVAYKATMDCVLYKVYSRTSSSRGRKVFQAVSLDNGG